jgi:DNA-binding NarL/FixJ family response regulator
VEMTLLIVDDDAGFRSGARALLEAAGWVVVGEADDGPSAVAMSRQVGPAVVLLDVQLPGADGFAVAEQLALEAMPPKVVLTSSRSQSSYRSRLAASAVQGFVAKSELTGAALAALVR